MIAIDWLKPMDRCSPDEQNAAEENLGCWIYDETDADDVESARQQVANRHDVPYEYTREHQD